jgi:hypothetical protein
MTLRTNEGGANEFNVYLLSTRYTWSWSWTTGRYYHIAVVRSSGSLTLFVDGVSLGTRSTSGQYVGKGTLRIGELLGGATSSKLNGNLDEIRLSKGVARWTANFTPATSPYDTGFSGTFDHFIGLLDNVSVWDTPRDDGEIFDRAIFVQKTGYPRAGLASPLNDLNFKTGVAVNFDASASFDPAGTNTSLVSYFWDFGDGTPLIVTTSPTLAHTYTKTGLMTIYLAVEDGDANFDSTSINLNLTSSMTLNEYKQNTGVRIKNIQKNQGW